jgi:hypothetical protein
MVSGMRCCFSRRIATVVLVIGVASAAAGCTGEKVPSYKDRIGAIDPATAPLSDDPPAPE